jgi:hypothetical protein
LGSTTSTFAPPIKKEGELPAEKGKKEAPRLFPNLPVNDGQYKGDPALAAQKLGDKAVDPALAKRIKKFNQAEENVDLSQFLPGGAKDPRRAIAGIVGPDGITGPHSSNWEKIHVRYRRLTETLDTESNSKD